MATFVLVHGPSMGGWIFARVARLLRAEGHDVFAPTLTGCGERSHLARGEINFGTHVEDVLNVLRWEDLHDVVLCGHAYGGAVVTGVADHMPGRVRSLVYLDSFIPKDGDTLWQHVPEFARSMLLATTAGHGGLRIDAVPGEFFNLNAADHDMFSGRCVPMPLACFLDPVRLTGAWQTVLGRHYLHATGWPTSPFLAVAETLKADPGWKVHSSPGGHIVMLDEPETVAKVLLSTT